MMVDVNAIRKLVPGPARHTRDDPRRYTYAWKNNTKRLDMHGRECKVLVWGRAMNSILVEFTDNGQREVTDRRSVRRIRHYR